MKEIGFEDQLVDNIVNLVISVGIAQDDELEQGIFIVPKENSNELISFMELEIDRFVTQTEDN